MKTIGLLAITTFIYCSSNGQNFRDSIYSCLKFKSWEELHKEVALLNTNEETFDYLFQSETIQLRSEQLIGPFYAEELLLEHWEMTNSDESSGSQSGVAMNLRVIRNIDKIIYVQISQIDPEYFENHVKKPWGNDTSFSNCKSLKKLKHLYKKKYNLEFNLNAVFVNEAYYGLNCVYEIEETAEDSIKQMAIDSIWMDSIDYWLRMPSASRQLYALEAAYKIRQKGGYWKKDWERLIELICQKEGTIETCSQKQGVVPFTQKPISEMALRIKKAYSD